VSQPRWRVALWVACLTACAADQPSASAPGADEEVEEQALPLVEAPTDYASVVLADGPVGYWRLGEQPGTNDVLDSSGNGYNGFYRVRTEPSWHPQLGLPGAIAGDSDTAARFFWYNNGKVTPITQWNYAEIPFNANLVQPPREFTLEAWFTMPPLLGHQTYSGIVATSSTNGHDGYGLMYYGYQVWFYIGHYNARVGFPMGLVSDDRFHHIVATWDGRTATIYLDGAVVASKVVGYLKPGAGPLWIGKAWSGGWQGMIDEVAIYHRALRADEAYEHYSAGKANLRVELRVPSSGDISEVALLGDEVRLGDGVRVVDPITGEPAAVAATGAAGITLGSGASTGALTSAGGARLGSMARAVGAVQLTGTLTLASDAEVTGSVAQNVPATAPRTLSWDVHWPSTFLGHVNLSAGQVQQISPGHHGDVAVREGALLSLGAGAYYLDALVLDAGATLQVDNAAGPVRIFVRDRLTYRGQIVRTHAAANVLVVYLGTSAVAVESALDASLWAPNATLTLHPTPTAHSGSFVAKVVDVLPGSVIERRPYRTLACMGDDCAPEAGEPPLEASCAEEGPLMRRFMLVASERPLMNTQDWACVLTRIGGELDEGERRMARVTTQGDYWVGFASQEVSAEATCVHRSCFRSERIAVSGPYAVKAEAEEADILGVTICTDGDNHEASVSGAPDQATCLSMFHASEPVGGGERAWIDQSSAAPAAIHASNKQCFAEVEAAAHAFRAGPAGQPALFHGPDASHAQVEAAGSFVVRSAGVREVWMPPIDEALCYLSEFGGKIAGGGEFATIEPRFDPDTQRTRWHLSAQHLSAGAPDGVFASARCYSMHQDVCEATPPLERSFACDARVRQRSDWQQETPAAVDMGPADDRACFLVRTRGHFEGGGESVHAQVVSGRWQLTGNSRQEGIAATAECVGVESMTDEKSWDQAQGAETVDLAPAEGYACFLTRMRGHFEGGGEVIHTRIENGRWVLGGNSAQDGGAVSASARCILVRSMGPERTWYEDGPEEELSRSPEDFCFLTRVEGKFKGGGEVVEVKLEALPDGGVRQVLTGSSGQKQVAGRARCVRLPTGGVIGPIDPPAPLPPPDCTITDTNGFLPASVCFLSHVSEDGDHQPVNSRYCRPRSCYERGDQGDHLAVSTLRQVSAGDECRETFNVLQGANAVAFLSSVDMNDAEGGEEWFRIDQAVAPDAPSTLRVHSCQDAIFGSALTLQLRRFDRAVHFMGPNDRVGPLDEVGEFSVASAATPVEVTMTPVATTSCVLTGVSGKFEGGGEFVSLDHSGPRWKLVAQHRSGGGLTATARCFPHQQPPL
jgi:hypothetical protein